QVATPRPLLAGRDAMVVEQGPQREIGRVGNVDSADIDQRRALVVEVDPDRRRVERGVEDDAAVGQL
nr:hypothetical protein [Tanacetum cinerariifolium]